MFFIILTTDKPGSAQLRADKRPVHLEYLESLGKKLVAGGASLSDDGETVTLRGEAVLDRDDDDARFHFFARNLGDHLAAAGENLLAESTAPFLERAVFYNNLRAGSVDEIEARARALAAEALGALNRMGFARQSDDAAHPDEASERFRFGIYFYREDEADRDEG